MGYIKSQHREADLYEIWQPTLGRERGRSGTMPTLLTSVQDNLLHLVAEHGNILAQAGVGQKEDLMTQLDAYVNHLLLHLGHSRLLSLWLGHLERPLIEKRSWLDLWQVGVRQRLTAECAISALFVLRVSRKETTSRNFQRGQRCDVAV